MLATSGDVIAVHGVGNVRKGTVLEARKGVERDVLLVRWEDGRTSLFIPGPSTTVEHPKER